MKDQNNYKNSISSDLYKFADLLAAYNLINDPKSIYEASEKVRVSQDQSIWKYKCFNLQFNMEGLIAGTIPMGVSSVDIIFNIEIEGIIVKDDKYYNPINSLKFDIELLGLSETSSDLYASWHLDKHIEEDNNNICNFIHPQFHLTFGGNKMENQGAIFGECLIVPTPRISYPPMDVILGIDFILQNYIRLEKRRKLMDDSLYKEIINNSQLRLWKPYFICIASKWFDFSEIDFDENLQFNKLLPFINHT